MSTPRPEQPVPPPEQDAGHPPPVPDEAPAERDGTVERDEAATVERGAPADGTADVAAQPDEPATDHHAPTARAVDVAHPSRVRRAPRYGRFAFLGLVLGALLALVLSLVGVSDYSTRDVFLILFIGLGTVGIFAGLGVALISDRRSGRRAD